MMRYRNSLKPVEPYRPDFLSDFEPINETVFAGLAWFGCLLLIAVVVLAQIFGIEL